jgi:hypothetical protein
MTLFSGLNGKHLLFSTGIRNPPRYLRLSDVVLNPIFTLGTSEETDIRLYAALTSPISKHKTVVITPWLARSSLCRKTAEITCVRTSKRVHLTNFTYTILGQSRQVVSLFWDLAFLYLCRAYGRIFSTGRKTRPTVSAKSRPTDRKRRTPHFEHFRGGGKNILKKARVFAHFCAENTFLWNFAYFAVLSGRLWRLAGESEHLLRAFPKASAKQLSNQYILG